MRSARPSPNPLCKPEALLPNKKPGLCMIQREGSVLSVGPTLHGLTSLVPRTHQAASQKGQTQGQAPTSVASRPPGGEPAGPEDPGLGAPCRLVSWGSVRWAPMVTSLVHQSWTWVPCREGVQVGGIMLPFLPPTTSWQSWGPGEGREGKPLGLIQEQCSQGKGPHWPGGT